MVPAIRKLSVSALASWLLLASPAVFAAQIPLPEPRSAFLSEDQLAKVCDARIRRYSSDFVVAAYEMTPEQTEAVRRRLEELKAEQIRYSLNTAARRDEIVRRLRSRGTSQPASERAELQEELQEMNRNHPLFWDASVYKEIEKLLPPEQAERGRRRIAESRTRSSEKMMTRVLARHVNPTAMGVDRMLASPDGWEKYVQQFCERFSLNEGQRSTASSLLREAVGRRDALLEREPDLIDRLTRDRTAAAGIEAIWEDLRSGLDRIPTQEQIRSADRGDRPPTATRPTDLILAPTGVRTPATHPATATAPN